MKISEKLQNSMGQSMEKVMDYLDQLSVHERYLVIFAMILVAVATSASLLWYTHAAANQQQNRANDLKALMVWMQDNAVTIQPVSDVQLTPLDKVQRVAQQQGLSVSSQQADKQIQIIVAHENYAILANFLMQLAQIGLSLEKIELISDAGQIKLTATVQ